jgi:predicted nicotinamide N-methyase
VLSNGEAAVWSSLQARRPRLCPEIELALVEPASPLGRAIRREGLWAVHEVFPGLGFPPHWAYAWAGGLALARHLLDHPELVRARSVVDVGLGSGIAAIAAALAGAARVRGIDRDPLAVEATRRNARRNGIRVVPRRGDARAFRPRVGEVVLASDVFYEGDSHEHRLQAWADAGATILAADASRGVLPGGVGIPLAEYEARTEPDIETTGPVRVLRVSATTQQPA